MAIPSDHFIDNNFAYATIDGELFPTEDQAKAHLAHWVNNAPNAIALIKKEITSLSKMQRQDRLGPIDSVVQSRIAKRSSNINKLFMALNDYKVKLPGAFSPYAVRAVW